MRHKERGALTTDPRCHEDMYLTQKKNASQQKHFWDLCSRGVFRVVVSKRVSNMFCFYSYLGGRWSEFCLILFQPPRSPTNFPGLWRIPRSQDVPFFSSFTHHGCHVSHFPYHPCMVYLPTFGWFFMVNVGKYTIHGSYGFVSKTVLKSQKL